jgi:hypothetical protein
MQELSARLRALNLLINKIKLAQRRKNQIKTKRTRHLWTQMMRRRSPLA